MFLTDITNNTTYTNQLIQFHKQVGLRRCSKSISLLTTIDSPFYPTNRTNC